MGSRTIRLAGSRPRLLHCNRPPDALRRRLTIPRLNNVHAQAPDASLSLSQLLLSGVEAQFPLCEGHATSRGRPANAACRRWEGCERRRQIAWLVDYASE